jgi:hypothetical protein
MKKKMLMLLMITSIFSCTEIDSRSVSYSPESSHSNNSSTKDLIIGNWHILLDYDTPISSNSNLIVDCEKKTSLSFNEDGSITGIIYNNGDRLNTICNEKEVNSTWKNNGDATYTIDKAPVEILFSENNNSLSIKFIDSNNIGLYNNGNSFYTFKKK